METTIELALRSFLAVALGSVWCFFPGTQSLVSPRLLVPVVSLVTVSLSIGQSIRVAVVVLLSSSLCGFGALTWMSLFGFSSASRAVGLIVLVLLLVLLCTHELAQKIGIAVVVISTLLSDESGGLTGVFTLAWNVVASTGVGSALGVLAMLPIYNTSKSRFETKLYASVTQSEIAMSAVIRSLAAEGISQSDQDTRSQSRPTPETASGQSDASLHNNCQHSEPAIRNTDSGSLLEWIRLRVAEHSHYGDREPLDRSEIPVACKLACDHADSGAAFLGAEWWESPCASMRLWAGRCADSDTARLNVPGSSNGCSLCMWRGNSISCDQYSCMSENPCCICSAPSYLDCCVCAMPSLGENGMQELKHRAKVLAVARRLPRIASLASEAERVARRSHFHDNLGVHLASHMIEVVKNAGRIHRLIASGPSGRSACTATPQCFDDVDSSVKSLRELAVELRQSQAALLVAFRKARNTHIVGAVASSVPQLRSAVLSRSEDQGTASVAIDPNVDQVRSVASADSEYRLGVLQSSNRIHMKDIVPVYSIIFLVIRWAQIADGLAADAAKVEIRSERHPESSQEEQKGNRLASASMHGISSPDQFPLNAEGITVSPALAPRQLQAAGSKTYSVAAARSKNADEQPVIEPKACCMNMPTIRFPSLGSCASNLCSMSWHCAWPRLRRATKVSLAVGLASIIELVPELKRPFGYWAPITVGFIVGSNSASSFQQSLLRFVGTTLGSIAGYAIVALASQSRIAQGVLLASWSAAVMTIRQSPQYGYAGLVAAFTAGIIVLADFPDTFSSTDVAVARIEATTFAIAVFLLVSNCVFPLRPRMLIASQSTEALHQAAMCMKSATQALCAGFSGVGVILPSGPRNDATNFTATDSTCYNSAIPENGEQGYPLSRSVVAVETMTHAYHSMAAQRFDSSTSDSSIDVSHALQYVEKIQESDDMLNEVERNIHLARLEPFRPLGARDTLRATHILDAARRISLAIRLLAQGARFMDLMQAQLTNSQKAPRISKLEPVVPWMRATGLSTAALLAASIVIEPKALSSSERRERYQQLEHEVHQTNGLLHEFEAVLDCFIEDVIVPIIRGQSGGSLLRDPPTLPPADALAPARLPLKSGEIVVISSALFGLELAARESVRLGNMMLLQLREQQHQIVI